MSTATAPRRQPAPRPAVRAVPVPAAAPARAPFVGVVLVLLVLGLGSLLLLNTLLAQGSFTLHTLDAQLTELTDREQALQQKVAELAAPQRLARRASAIGMVPAQNPAFLRASDGKVLGVPVPAAAPVLVTSEPTTDDEPEGKQDGKPEGKPDDKPEGKPEGKQDGKQDGGAQQ